MDGAKSLTAWRTIVTSSAVGHAEFVSSCTSKCRVIIDEKEGSESVSWKVNVRRISWYCSGELLPSIVKILSLKSDVMEPDVVLTFNTQLLQLRGPLGTIICTVTRVISAL